MNSLLPGGYRYAPLSKAQAVMLLLNHLNGDECVRNGTMGGKGRKLK